MMCIIFLYDCFRALLTPNVSVVSLVVVYACVRMSATLAERCSSTLLLLILQSCNSVISTHGRRELMRQEAFVTVVDAKTTTTTMSRIHKRKKKLKRCCHHCYSRQNSFRTSPESPSESNDKPPSTKVYFQLASMVMVFVCPQSALVRGRDRQSSTLRARLPPGWCKNSTIHISIYIYG